MSQIHQVVLARVVEVPTSVLAFAITSIVAITIYVQFFYDSRRRHLPPGPRGWPIVGNSFQISFEKDPAPQLAKWTKEFGEMFYLSIGGSDFVFLNSPRVVKDLFEKKGTVYSDKPEMPMAEEAYAKGLNLSLMHYNQRWKVLFRKR
jgi:Cytochrome P450